MAHSVYNRTIAYRQGIDRVAMLKLLMLTGAGVNLTAIYQDDELTDKETFQVEFEKRTDQWRLRTADDTYWILVESGSGIQSNGNSR